jgi:hypothetical protein
LSIFFKIWLKPIKALKGDLKSCEIIENSLFLVALACNNSSFFYLTTPVVDCNLTKYLIVRKIVNNKTPNVNATSKRNDLFHTEQKYN